MPREFITNIDTANEEIIRLDSSIETSNSTLLSAQQESTRLIAERETAISERDAALARVTEFETRVAELSQRVDEADRRSVQAAAAAGVSPVAVMTEEVPEDRFAKLHGIQKAMAVRQAQFEEEKSRR